MRFFWWGLYLLIFPQNFNPAGLRLDSLLVALVDTQLDPPPPGTSPRGVHQALFPTSNFFPVGMQKSPPLGSLRNPLFMAVIWGWCAFRNEASALLGCTRFSRGVGTVRALIEGLQTRYLFGDAIGQFLAPSFSWCTCSEAGTPRMGVFLYYVTQA